MSNWKFNNVNGMWINLNTLITIEIMKNKNFYEIVGWYSDGDIIILNECESKENCEKWLQSFMSGIKEELLS
jgi:hypothetical protein